MRGQKQEHLLLSGVGAEDRFGIGQRFGDVAGLAINLEKSGPELGEVGRGGVLFFELIGGDAEQLGVGRLKRRSVKDVFGVDLALAGVFGCLRRRGPADKSGRPRGPFSPRMEQGPVAFRLCGFECVLRGVDIFRIGFKQNVRGPEDLIKFLRRQISRLRFA